MSKKDEALKLALENICAAKLCEFNSMSSRHEMIRLMDAAITAIREALADQPAQQEWPKPKFVRNVDGVPCITLVEHEHLMCSRSKPAQQQPLTGLLSIARRHPDGQVVTVSFKTLDAAIAFEQYALDVAYSTKEQP